MKAKIPVGYLFEYKAVPTQKQIEFANLQQVKLVTILNIYSKFNDHSKIDKILSNRQTWPYNNEIKYLDYKLIKSISITGRLLKVRKSCFWIIERRTIPEIINEKSIESYTCFTNLYHLKYISNKYRTQCWIFTNKKSKHTYLLKDVKHYNRLIKKGRVVVIDDVVAKQCLKLRASMGHKTEFIYDEKLIPKCATLSKTSRLLSIPKDQPNHSFEHDPYQQKLVCITDGTTVWRIKYYQAIKRVAKFPKTITFCSKVMWQNYIKEMQNGRAKPSLSTKGGKPNCKYPGEGTRKERRKVLQKQKISKRYHKVQLINSKRIIHRMTPIVPTKMFYNPKNRKQHNPSMFDKIETTVKGIEISKFPYNKPIVVIYTRIDKDGIVQHKKIDKVKMINKHIIQQAGDDEISICPVKDVEKWCSQEDYDRVKGESPIWTEYIKIVPITKTKLVRRIERIQHIIKKKQWRHPIKQTWWERRGLKPF